MSQALFIVPCILLFIAGFCAGLGVRDVWPNFLRHIWVEDEGWVRHTKVKKP